jgi:Fe-S oxidoreductase
MYDPRHVIELIADNVRKTRNPFGTPAGVMNNWWKDVPLRREGDAMLFTGMMYQSVPFIHMTTDMLERYEDSWLSRFMIYGKYMPKLLVGLGSRVMVLKRKKQEFNTILANIVKVLNRSGVDFFYRHELDFYSGVLLYDLGDQQGFERHARFVAETLKRKGINKLITVDPHTTYALKELYPKYTGESFDVRAYFELVDFKPESAGENGNGNGRDRVTLHDPCFYGRYLKLSDVPERLLSGFGVECMEVRQSGEFTHCCGGPAESVSPALSKEIPLKRFDQLKENRVPIVAMCPICLGNLMKLGGEVEDLSTLIARHA